MSEIFVITVTSGLGLGFAVSFVAYFLGYSISKSLHLFEL